MKSRWCGGRLDHRRSRVGPDAGATASNANATPKKASSHSRPIFQTRRYYVERISANHLWRVRALAIDPWSNLIRSKDVPEVSRSGSGVLLQARWKVKLRALIQLLTSAPKSIKIV